VVFGTGKGGIAEWLAGRQSAVVGDARGSCYAVVQAGGAAGLAGKFVPVGSTNEGLVGPEGSALLTRFALVSAEGAGAIGARVRSRVWRGVLARFGLRGAVGKDVVVRRIDLFAVEWCVRLDVRGRVWGGRVEVGGVGVRGGVSACVGLVRTSVLGVFAAAAGD
jgi:hypothetical protein